ncbi:uncharacterized protein LOC127944599 isoform X2 [Carassius gibelio]|uniref:uncharacterized protein LOC127944599 isoform X2 n=1 Tax=Carassius gibelio TaxID=101364 RepID=UPI002277A2C2|nr:uncharacterized protein LOC127944599 isoform X2 [Carassius gibelio]
MRNVFFFVLVFSVVFCNAELKLEATDGENVTIPFKTAELEGADQVRITFTRDDEKMLIARYVCDHHRDCRVVERAGVSLRIEEGTVSLILLDVSSSNSGLYEAQVLNGKYVSEIQATLVVKEPVLSSTKETPQTSSPKPPDSSGHLWLWLCALLILPVLTVIGFCWRKKCGRDHVALPYTGEARETSDVSSAASSKKYMEKNCTGCVAVSFKTCRETTDDQLLT